ncbi:hypothetical protein T492DRAFT_1062106 [Pavlovales sp. CCMP2436]|nr:hypothetical protein T492DRAFT_1062106 [Pavlovales sp. CCMP2436]
MPRWPRWLRMPGWPHSPLSPRARHNPRRAGPHEASTRHLRCQAPGTRSAGEGLMVRCTQPREARKVGCGEARAAAPNARSPSVSPRCCCGVPSRGRAAPRPSEGAQVGQPHRPGLAFRSGNHARRLPPLDDEHRTTGAE